jgi:hypothetical protein
MAQVFEYLPDVFEVLGSKKVPQEWRLKITFSEKPK